MIELTELQRHAIAGVESPVSLSCTTPRQDEPIGSLSKGISGITLPPSRRRVPKPWRVGVPKRQKVSRRAIAAIRGFKEEIRFPLLGIPS